MNERKKRVPPSFHNQMSRVQTVLGWCYVPLHAAVIPLLLAMAAAFVPEQLDEITVNILYYALGAVFVALVMGRYLRRQFDVLLDNLLRCALAFLMTFLVEYALSLVSALLILLLEENIVNPNNEAILALAEQDYGAIRGLAVFIGPVVEEVLFRGVVFGSLRGKNRVLAYVVSIAVFALYHVWQYALLDPLMLLYAVQYIPAAFALAWAYEHSNCIWVPIFFHMISNALSLYVLTLL